MLLLRRCCASPREKKKKSASSTHISKEILENLWELRRKQQELFRIMGKRVRLTDSEHNSTGPAEPAIQLPAARRGVSPPPHSPSSQEKTVFCQVSTLNQPSSRSAKKREILSRYFSHTPWLLARSTPFYKSIQCTERLNLKKFHTGSRVHVSLWIQ